MTVCARECCQAAFIPSRGTHRYCSPSCSKKDSDKKQRADPNNRRYWYRLAAHKNDSARKRARAYGNHVDTTVTPIVILGLIEAADRCPICDVEMTWTRERCDATKKELDHIKPLWKGGPHELGNLRVLCQSCNTKGTKPGRPYPKLLEQR